MPRPLPVLALLVLAPLLAGCVQDNGTGDGQQPEIDLDDPEPFPVTAVTGHALVVDANGTRPDGHSATPDNASWTGDGEPLHECIAWPGGIETTPPYAPVAANATAPYREHACTEDKRAAQGVTTDHAILTGDILPGQPQRGTPFFVAAVERGDCAPASGTDFEEVDKWIVHDVIGHRYQVGEYRHVCTATGERETFFLTRSGTVRGESDASMGSPVSWLLVIDTCDDDSHIGPGRDGRCTDGRAERLDDTERGVIRHAGTDPDGGAHRATCRNVADRWVVWDETGDAEGACQDEHHFTAALDLYFYEVDPTRLWDP